MNIVNSGVDNNITGHFHMETGVTTFILWQSGSVWLFCCYTQVTTFSGPKPQSLWHRHRDKCTQHESRSTFRTSTSPSADKTSEKCKTVCQYTATCKPDVCPIESESIICIYLDNVSQNATISQWNRQTSNNLTVLSQLYGPQWHNCDIGYWSDCVSSSQECQVLG